MTVSLFMIMIFIAKFIKLGVRRTPERTQSMREERSSRSGSLGRSSSIHAPERGNALRQKYGVQELPDEELQVILKRRSMGLADWEKQLQQDGACKYGLQRWVKQEKRIT